MEEEIQFTSYNPQLMRRLLRYAKPYWHLITLAIVLLLFATGVQLLRPFIVGKAVDTVFEKEPSFYKVSSSGTSMGDLTLDLDHEVTLKDLTGEGEYVLIQQVKQAYYLVDSVPTETVKAYLSGQFEIEGTELDGSQPKIILGDATYNARRLVKDEILAMRGKDVLQLIQLVAGYLLLIVIGFLTAYAQAYILQHAGQRIIVNIRNEVFAHIQSQSIHYFNGHPVGTLVTRITNDTETLNQMYTSVIANSIKNVFMIFGILAVMFSLNVTLTILVILILPVIIVLTFVYKKYSRENFRVVRSRVAKINAFLSEHIQGMKIIQIFSKEEEVYKEFKTYNKELLQSNMKEIIMFGLYRPMMYLMYIVGLCIVIGYGGNLALKSVITVGTLVIFLQYVNRFFQPIQELAEQFNILQAAMAAAEKIFKVLDTKDFIENPEKPVEHDAIAGEIEFKNVWFSYDDGHPVLRDVSFHVNPGEKIAFVGATGSGKTTILNLISRYYDVDQGSILIDGIDVKDYDKAKLRQRVGQMLQDVFLFTGDIKSNIRLRNEEITIDEIKEAAAYVNAHSFIQQLPQGYDQEVVERGATLSTGQRQLLSFARTLVSDPSVLILDEATANIDTETEQLIQDALEKLMENRTTLVVAHRLSTIQHADKIIVLHKGKIREMGNHQELLSKKGFYYRLYELQYKEQNNDVK